ncbi:MAG: glucose-6-phosphate isomerase [Planctomycetota bacterium]|jgi:glucose-6-phosphate isomerase
MAKSQIKFYYKNVTSKVIGDEHGISPEQFKTLAETTATVIAQINQQRKQGKTPYRDLPYNEKISQRVKKVAEEIKDRCENFVVLGIGGSALGNIALNTSLKPYMNNINEKARIGPRLFVFDNVDPDQFGSFLQWASDKLDKTIFNVISKSGRTSETAAQMLIVNQMLTEKLGPDGIKKHLIATTDANKGTLRKIADEFGLLTLEVPDGVGGRFTVLSAVGLLMAAVAEMDIDSLLAGARDMDARVSNEDFFKNPAALNAAVNYHYYNNGKRNSVMMPYSYALKDFADWYRQLWAESLGKAVDLHGNIVNIGPTPIKALGTTDQHSQVQLYREGPNDKLFTFLQCNSFNTHMEIGPAPDCSPELAFLAGKDLAQLLNNEKIATEYALLTDKRPCLTVLFDKVDAYTVGQFIYLFEVTTSIIGAMFAINPYDQPAVELGKEATFALMGREDFADLAKKIQPMKKFDEDFLI